MRAAMCDIGRRLWQRGLVGATEGNISVRLDSRKILCTPTGVSKGHLKPNQLVVIDNKGVSLSGGQPSSEIKLHLKILAKRKDCHAVIHAHPPIATGFALAGENIPDNLMPESDIVLGSVAMVRFCMPGTEEVPSALEPLVDDYKTFLLSHHGAATMGKDLEDAYNRMETLERVAKIYLVSKMLGGPAPMPESAQEAFRKMAANPGF